MRKILLAVLVVGISISLAQERADESSAIVADTVINSGWLILHGRLLERPYHFHLENDTFWINGMQYLPSPPDPLQKSPEWVPEYTELGKWYYKTNKIFTNSCITKYKRWRHKLGAVMAMDSLLQYINTQKLMKIKSVECPSPEGNSVTLVYDYRQLDLISNPTPRLIEVLSKPESEYMSLILLLWTETDADTTWVPRTQGEIYLSAYNDRKDLLAVGMFIYLPYGGGWHEYGRVKGREIEFINTIKEILVRPITENQMIQELREKVDIDSLESIYIIYNRDYWLEDFKEGRNE